MLSHTYIQLKYFCPLCPFRSFFQTKELLITQDKYDVQWCECQCVIFSYQMSTITRLQFNPTPSGPLFVWTLAYNIWLFYRCRQTSDVSSTYSKGGFLVSWMMNKVFLNIIVSQIVSLFSDSLAHKKKIKVFLIPQPSLSTPSQTRKLVVIIMMEEDWYKYLVLFKKLRLVKQNVSKCPFEYCSGKY